MSSAAPVLVASSLAKRYGDLLAVDHVSFQIGRGEIYALLGLNGAGKTTTIRMLLGMVRPTGGEVTLFGARTRPGRQDAWSRVGYLVETPAAYPELTVEENLAVVARLRRLTDRRAVGDVIHRLGLGRLARQPARTLSLGNAQRLGLAKALVHRPDLLILDEPANGLDPAGVAEVRQLLRELADDGTTIMLSSHILTEVARLATRIGVIDQGRLVREFDTAELAGHARARLVVDTRDGAAAAAALHSAGFTPQANGACGFAIAEDLAVRRPDAIATLLVEAGCPPTRLVVEHDDLETYFLRLVGGAR